MRLQIVFLLVCGLMVSCAATLSKNKEITAFVDKEFLNNAKKAELRHSAFTLVPGVFNQPVFDYSIIDATISWVSKNESRLVDKNVSEKNIESDVINWLFFDNPYPFHYEHSVESKLYEKESKSKFSFTVNGVGKLQSRVDCRHVFLGVFSESKSADVSHGFYTNESSTSISDVEREITYISCGVKQFDKTWSFSAEIPFRKKIKFYFSEPSDILRIVPLFDFCERQDNGEIKTAKDFLPWVPFQVSGFEIYYKEKIVGALSIIGKPYVWIANDLPEDLSEKVILLQYTMYMFNQIDPLWQ